MHPKVKRIVNKELITYLKNRPCAACGRLYVDVHHIVSRGAGGGDVLNNLIPLCREHHTEIHQIGQAKMIEKFPSVKIWLDKIGHKK